MRKAYFLKFLIDFISGIFWTANVSSLIKNGFSLADSALVMAGFYFAIAFFEIPTGYVADKFGRKKSVLSGLLLVAIGFFLLYLSTGKGLNIMGAGVAGIGFTLISGAFTAWVYNLAHSEDAQFDPTRFFLRFDAFGRIAVIAGGFGGAWILKIEPSTLWLFLAFAGVVALVAGFSTPAGSTDLSHEDSTFSLRQLKKSHFIENWPLVLLLVGTLVFGLEQGIRNTLFQPFVLKLRDGDELFLAYWQSGLAVLRLCGLLFYRQFLIGKSRTTLLIVGPLVALGATEAVASCSSNFWLIWGLWLAAVFTFGWFFPLKDAFLNSLIPEKLRATFLSLDSMLFQLGSGMTCLLLYGYATEANFQSFWVVGFGALAISALLLYRSVEISKSKLMTRSA